ncbi:MAG TPA: LCP family protein, partial [Thermomicrobiales bacterium]|nr:LCP family protein [Thermomicrobiales bacterium]
MPNIPSLSTISRRRAITIGAGAVIAAMTGTGSALGRQSGGSEYTFVVAGLDYREGFDEHNSDVLMVSRVNLDLGTVRTVSIPRDLYVEIPGYGFDKITRAFHHGYYSNGESW